VPATHDTVCIQSWEIAREKDPCSLPGRRPDLAALCQDLLLWRRPQFLVQPEPKQFAIPRTKQLLLRQILLLFVRFFLQPVIVFIRWLQLLVGQSERLLIEDTQLFLGQQYPEPQAGRPPSQFGRNVVLLQSQDLLQRQPRRGLFDHQPDAVAFGLARWQRIEHYGQAQAVQRLRGCQPQAGQFHDLRHLRRSSPGGGRQQGRLHPVAAPQPDLH
jgi:hypothetical protein